MLARFALMYHNASSGPHNALVKTGPFRQYELTLAVCQVLNVRGVAPNSKRSKELI
jgi:hypothetical protein